LSVGGQVVSVGDDQIMEFLALFLLVLLLKYATLKCVL